MGLPFLNGAEKKPSQLVSIDLGGRTTKAVHLQRRNEKYVLHGYAMLDAPVYERSMTAELLAEHLQAVTKSLASRTKTVSLSLGVHESVLRHAELPLMPIGDMRQVLKMNTKNYLQQDLPGHVFDCFIMAAITANKTAEKPKVGSGAPRAKVLVAGARKQLLDDVQAAAKSAGLAADHIVPSAIGPVNAFESAMPEIFAKEVVALVDIGFRNTTICLLQNGELVLSRVVGIGGDRVTQGLAEALGISYAEAEGIKVGMPGEVQSNLEALVIPLGRELRASIDFFEHQQDKAVSQIYVSGAASRSETILQILQGELIVECKTWNPLNFVEPNLSPDQTSELEHVAPQLTVALGAGMAAL